MKKMKIWKNSVIKFKEDIRQLERINKDFDIYTNKKLLSGLSTQSDGKEILVKFKENFDLIREYIDKIMSSLIANVSIIPYTLRCICKIIDILITKKVDFFLYSFHILINMKGIHLLENLYLVNVSYLF